MPILQVDSSNFNIFKHLFDQDDHDGHDGVFYLAVVSVLSVLQADSTPGVWFCAVSHGGTMTDETCSFADYDSSITVLEGSCLEPIGVDGSSEGCLGDDFFPSTVPWLSTSRTEYLILVHSSFADVGKYELTVIFDLLFNVTAVVDASTVEMP